MKNETALKNGTDFQVEELLDPKLRNTLDILMDAWLELDVRKLRSIMAKNVKIKKQVGKPVSGIENVVKVYKEVFEIGRSKNFGNYYVSVTVPNQKNFPDTFLLEILNSNDDNLLYAFLVKIKDNKIIEKEMIFADLSNPYENQVNESEYILINSSDSSIDKVIKDVKLKPLIKSIVKAIQKYDTYELAKHFSKDIIMPYKNKSLIPGIIDVSETLNDIFEIMKISHKRPNVEFKIRNNAGRMEIIQLSVLGRNKDDLMLSFHVKTRNYKITEIECFHIGFGEDRKTNNKL